ncbi:MAG: transporter substrate-binding domain-containing protein [Campylobacterales bacterium]
MKYIFSAIFYSLIFFIMPLSAAQTVELTPAEKEYIQKTKSIKMCVDPDWVPFERINQDGKHEGIAADLIALVSARTGLKIELYPVKTWDESVEASKSGKCQIMSFLNQTPARDKWLIFTEPIFIDPNVFITREEHSFIADAKNLSNESIALPRNTMVAEKIQKDYPNIRVIGTSSEEEAVNLVSEKKADMTMRSLIVAAYTIKKEGLFNLKIAGQIQEYTNKLRIGVLKDETVLRDILNKGVLTITPAEMEQISNKHVSIKAETGIDYSLVYKILVASMLIIGAAIYWNRRLAKFNAKISALQNETKEALYQVATLLNNSTNGFLSFGKNLTVDKEYSTECERMLGTDISGKPISSLLCGQDAEDRRKLEANLLRVLECKDDFKSEMLISLLPKTYKIGALTLAAKYKLLENGSMMLVLTDITEELALSEQIAKEQSKLRFVVAVFKEKEDVQNLIAEFRLFLSSTNADGLAKSIHTFKGLFAQFDFYFLPKELHSLENSLCQKTALDVSDVKTLENALEADIQTLYEIARYDILGTKEKLCIDKDELNELESRLETLSLQDIKTRLQRFRHKPFCELLAHYPRYTASLANRLGKRVKDFGIDGGEFAVDPDKYAAFSKSLVHLFRNAVDHAIEDAATREEQGKDEEATIKCKITANESFITIEISDDGAGIDVDKLIKKAKQKEIPIPQNPLMLVFEENLSSKEEATQLSGRGIGLGAVKSELEKLGGEVQIASELGKGSSFLFKIPMPNEK